MRFFSSVAFATLCLFSFSSLQASYQDPERAKSLKYLSYADLDTVGFVDEGTHSLEDGGLYLGTLLLGFYFDHGPEYRCSAMKAQKMSHPDFPKKGYLVFSTHEDDCDGGNTIGMVIEYEKDTWDSKPAVVAEIGDTELYPREGSIKESVELVFANLYRYLAAKVFK